MVLVLEENPDRGPEIGGAIPERTHIQVQMGRARITGIAGERDDLSSVDLLVFLDEHLVFHEVIIGSNGAIRVPDENVVTFAGFSVTGVSFFYSPNIAAPIAGNCDNGAFSGSPDILSRLSDSITIRVVYKVEGVGLAAVRVSLPVASDRVVPIPSEELPSGAGVEGQSVDRLWRAVTFPDGGVPARIFDSVATDDLQLEPLTSCVVIELLLINCGGHSVTGNPGRA